MNNLSRKAAVAGVYEHPTRFAPDKTVFQIMAESMKGALDDAGLTVKDVDGVCTAGMGGLGIIGLCDYLNLTPNYVDSTSIGGCSFVAHTAHAAAAKRTTSPNIRVSARSSAPPKYSLFRP